MQKKISMTQGTVTSCNVSYKKEINSDTLVGVLSGKLSFAPWKSHFDTFFNELPHTYIKGVMEENNLTILDLKTVFDSLNPAYQGKNFKELLRAGV